MSPLRVDADRLDRAAEALRLAGERLSTPDNRSLAGPCLSHDAYRHQILKLLTAIVGREVVPSD